MKSDAILTYPSIPPAGTRSGQQTFSAAELQSIRRYTLGAVKRADSRSTALVFDARSNKRAPR